MQANVFWENPALVPYRREWKAGDKLFGIGDPASEAIYIVSGTACLRALKHYQEFTVSYVGSEQFLGEQVLWGHSTGKRSFSAIALAPLRALVLDAQAVASVETKDPALLIKLLRHVASNTAQRLQRANYLIAHFRSENKAEKLTYLIVYLARAFGKQDALGTEVSLSKELVSYYLEMPAQEIDRVLAQLCRDRIISASTGDAYIIRDMKLLEEKAEQLSGTQPVF